jgi:DNA-directed RNA polymerase delta subunit
MKTAIQELIEHIQINATKFSLMNTYNMLKEIESYLEKEKEQIKDAWDAGMSEGIGTTMADLDLDGEFINYYNETYNQNK